MRQHYSDDRAVTPKRSPDTKNMSPIILPDTPLEGGRVTGLRSVGQHSELYPMGMVAIYAIKLATRYWGQRLKQRWLFKMNIARDHAQAIAERIAVERYMVKFHELPDHIQDSLFEQARKQAQNELTTIQEYMQHD